MKFTVYELPKAKFDKDRIFEWLFQRSPQGTAGWLSAYDEMIERLQGRRTFFPWHLKTGTSIWKFGRSFSRPSEDECTEPFFMLPASTCMCFAYAAQAKGQFQKSCCSNN